MDDQSGFGGNAGRIRDARDPRLAASPGGEAGVGGAGGPGQVLGGGLNPAQLQGLAGMLGLATGTGDARDKRGPRIDGRDARDVRSGGRATDAGGASREALVELHGEGRLTGPTTTSEPATVTIDGAGLTIAIGAGRPVRAGFRDVSLIAIQQSTALIVLGDGPDAMRFLLERFGDKLGPMVRMLRELRLKQRLSDGLVEVPDEPAELIEFAWTPTESPLGAGPDGPATATTDVGQLVIEPWGFVICPIDERQSWIHYRRASIAKVTTPSPGDVVVEGAPGTLTLRGLGAATKRLNDRLQKLRDGAFADASGFVEQLMPDAPFGLRQKASETLVDGRPTRPAVFGDGWPVVETAILGEPTFAESYESLCSTAGEAAPRWVSMSPESPGSATNKIWFLVAMPGNLVALELVTAGAHATYFFRVMPRAQYRGEPPDKLGIAAEQAVRDISGALVDCRFLREPMALPDDQLRLPKYLRYRLALAVLPTLAAARARFVARIVHKDPASWASAVADLIKWHATATDEAAQWPGRAAQERMVAATGEEGEDDESAEAPAEAEATTGASPSGTAG